MAMQVIFSLSSAVVKSDVEKRTWATVRHSVLAETCATSCSDHLPLQILAVYQLNVKTSLTWRLYRPSRWIWRTFPFRVYSTPST